MPQDLHMLLPSNRHSYNFAIYQVGYEKCKPTHFFGPTIRDFYVFHLLLSGKGEYHVRNKVFRLEAGDCFLVVPNEPIFYRADPEDPYEYYWVGFHGHNATEIMTHCGFYTDDNFVCRAGEDSAEMRALMAEMCAFEESSEKNELVMLGDFYRLLGLLIDESGRFEPDLGRDETLERINRYISMNYQQNLSVDGLARYLNVHRSSLYRLMMKEYGVSPVEYIRNYRLDQALFMLKRSDMMTKQIAVACGFQDVNYFCKLFRKKFHKNVHEVRQLV